MTDLEFAILHLDGIAVGSGPSSRQLIGMDLPNRVKLVGAGIVTQYLKVDYFAFGDPIHTKHVPKAPAITYSTRHKEGTPLDETGTGVVYFIDETIPDDPKPEDVRFFPSGQPGWHHGCSTGGMAICIACKLFERVGIIGFDGYYADGKVYDPPGLKGQQQCIDSIRADNRKIVSLMDVSLLNDRLVNYHDYARQIRQEYNARNPKGDAWLGS